MNRVIVVGSINVDLVAAVDRFPRPGETVLGFDLRRFPGGKGANQAVAAARLGARTAMVGAVGDDAFGAEMLAFLGSMGVDKQDVLVRPGASTGTALISVCAGENTIVVVPGANASVDTRSIDVLDLHAGDVVLCQLEVPIPTVAGDCFCGALATSLARGMTIEAAVKFANVAGSIAVQRIGAGSGMPVLAEVEACFGPT